jgi:hypothetical protein
LSVIFVNIDTMFDHDADRKLWVTIQDAATARLSKGSSVGIVYT